MAPILEIFVEVGGLWVTLIGALAWIEFSRRADIQDDAGRWVAALSASWILRSAVVIALMAWAWNFGRMFFGDAYLRGSGVFPELSTLLLVAVVVLAGVAWYCISLRSCQPWVTVGLVLAIVLSSAALPVQAPREPLAQGEDNDRQAVVFVQGRLASLDCFAAAGEKARRDGTFDALTGIAFLSFKAANGLDDPDIDFQPDHTVVVRPGQEFSLLSRPFPVLLGPRHCPLPG
jgi:hypothetical protein